jgi:alcohol dehydrogenase
MTTMTAARLYRPGSALQLDQVPIPVPGPDDVVVRVKACNIVPNLKNVLSADWPRLYPHLPLPKLPAIFGLDAAGVVAATGKSVLSIREGDRVYVNPARGCGSCRACRSGDLLNCGSFIYQGYFGRGPMSQGIFERYPYGGLAEYTMAPASGLVKLPAGISFEAAARLGYTGTGYSALRKAKVGPGCSVLINGIGGTLGLGAALSALALGATRVLGTGRNESLLARVRAIAPERIHVLSVGATSIRDWALSLTDGEGVDAVIDCLPPRTPTSAVMDALEALRMGGRQVDVGGTSDPLTIPGYWIKSRNAQLMGSRWFTTGEGEEMAALAEAGLLNLDVYEHRRFPLALVNDAIAATGDGTGGFSNVVVLP